jgi:hypothetical protein
MSLLNGITYYDTGSGVFTGAYPIIMSSYFGKSFTAPGPLPAYSISLTQNSGSLVLTWTNGASTPALTGIVAYLVNKAGGSVSSGTLSGTATTYSWSSGLINGNTYYGYVISTNIYGSIQSVNSGDQLYTLPLPTAAYSISLTQNSGSLVLTWTNGASTPALTGIVAWLINKSGGSLTSTTLSGTATTYSWSSGLTDGNTYYGYVISTNDFGSTQSVNSGDQLYTAPATAVGYSGPLISKTMLQPLNIALDLSGNLYIHNATAINQYFDGTQDEVFQITPTGSIVNIATGVLETIRITYDLTNYVFIFRTASGPGQYLLTTKYIINANGLGLPQYGASPSDTKAIQLFNNKLTINTYTRYSTALGAGANNDGLTIYNAGGSVLYSDDNIYFMLATIPSGNGTISAPATITPGNTQTLNLTHRDIYKMSAAGIVSQFVANSCPEGCFMFTQDMSGNFYALNKPLTKIYKTNIATASTTTAVTISNPSVLTANNTLLPYNLCIGPNNIFYVTVKQAIIKINSGGTASIFCGGYTNEGFVDGVGIAAKFAGVRAGGVIGSMICDAVGVLFVVDAINKAIRRVTPDGTVTTIVR